MKLNVLCILVALTAMPAGAAAHDYYVAPDGNDENPGTVERPFPTANRFAPPSFRR